MRLLRYLEIERMTHRRSKDAPMSEPQSYGFGAWHQALRDLAAEVGSARLKKEFATVAIGKPMVTAGADGIARRMQRRVDIEALIDEDGEIGPGHVACELSDDDWRPLITKLFKAVERPKAETPEIAAAEKVAAEKDTALGKANQRIRELEVELAKSASSAAAQ